MKLTTDQMQIVLEENVSLLDDYETAVSLGFEIDDEDNVVALKLTVSSLERAGITKKDMGPAKGDFDLSIIAVEGPEIEEDLGGPEDEEDAEEESSKDTMGMSGTKVREGGGWGTLCLFGGSIKIAHSSINCELNEPFLLSNSHVFHIIGGTVKSADYTEIGAVAAVGNLEAKETFDTGVAQANSNLDSNNSFLVYRKDGNFKKIEGLKNAEKNMKISKQGARTGWSDGVVKYPAIITVKGHKARYRCWKGKYHAKKGDSGSPILSKKGGKYYLVGIHFAGGSHFHSWNNAQITATAI